MRFQISKLERNKIAYSKIRTAAGWEHAAVMTQEGISARRVEKKSKHEQMKRQVLRFRLVAHRMSSNNQRNRSK